MRGVVTCFTGIRKKDELVSVSVILSLINNVSGLTQISSPLRQNWWISYTQWVVALRRIWIQRPRILYAITAEEKSISEYREGFLHYGILFINAFISPPTDTPKRFAWQWYALLGSMLPGQHVTLWSLRLHRTTSQRHIAWRPLRDRRFASLAFPPRSINTWSMCCWRMAAFVLNWTIPSARMSWVDPPLMYL